MLTLCLCLWYSVLLWWQGAPSFLQGLAWHQLEQTCRGKTTHLQNFRSKLQTYHYSTTLRPSAPSVGSLSRESDIIQFPPAPQRNDPPRPWRDTIPPPARFARLRFAHICAVAQCVYPHGKQGWLRALQGIAPRHTFKTTTATANFRPLGPQSYTYSLILPKQCNKSPKTHGNPWAQTVEAFRRNVERLRTFLGWKVGINERVISNRFGVELVTDDTVSWRTAQQKAKVQYRMVLTYSWPSGEVPKLWAYKSKAVECSTCFKGRVVTIL